MKKIIFLALIFIASCQTYIPEELVPLMGYWNLKEYGEYGVYDEHFFFTVAKIAKINDETYTTIYGSELVGKTKSVRLKYYGLLADDCKDDIYSGSEYEYVTIRFRVFADSGEWLGNQVYYFNFIDDNNIEGIYQSYSTFNISTSGTFEGTRDLTKSKKSNHEGSY